VCANAIDDDCSARPQDNYDGIDDKDLDGDDHIDAACVNFTYGDRPIDDCDDLDNATYPGAYEASDGKDNDCDGQIDNGGPNYDDDGDCYCESAPCYGSADPYCLNPVAGDCNDQEPTAYPGNFDVPDMLYIDGNCDGVDGDIADSVFVDPNLGSNGNTGLDQYNPVWDLDTAFAIALSNNRRWILISAGTAVLVNNFEQGKNLAGGYESSNGWARNGVVYPEIALTSAGKTLTNWTVPTEWQQIEVSSSNALASGTASQVLFLNGSSGLVLNEVLLTAGDGANGINGVKPSMGSAGSAGGAGISGYERQSNTDGWGICWDLLCGCPQQSSPTPGGGGGACGAGTAGASGGTSGAESSDGYAGLAATSGGAGGTKGLSNGGNAGAGGDGTSGSQGSNGAAGINIGTVASSGYITADGLTGLSGGDGTGGGGGGGGAGGGWTSGNCDVFGGSGGGGGGGGCGGAGATGGGGGGASVGVVLYQSSITIQGGDISTARGGDGGAGGDGADGGNGGNGGNQGYGTGSIINENSGDGGQGGDGGDGGQGGHGGGGGGGPSISILCDTNSTFSDDGTTTYSQGTAGAGGASAGDNGDPGLNADSHGC
jgi:hypothetical protein